MKEKLIFIIGFGVFSLMSIWGQNPIVRHLYTADPSAHVWADGRLYVYPSQDINPPRGCDLMDKYHVFSTDDMVNWVDHGQILEAADVPWGNSLADGGKFMWAPDCAYKDGKYYFYFPHPNKDPWNENWKIGIAVSDKPASDFKVLDHTLIGLPEKGEIDPCVFVDDDGQAYFYYGGGGKCYGAKLKDNMVELDGPLLEMQGLYDFHEGTWIFKKNGTYYLTYADNKNGGNQLRHATSDSPLGPWAHKGAYLTSTTSDTSHGSVVEYKGQWWAFYHTADLSGTGLLRSICVDSLFFNENGTIKTVKQTKDKGTSYYEILPEVPGTIEAENFNNGGQGIAYWDTSKGNLYSEYRSEDVDINRSRRSGMYYVTNTESKEYLNYSFEVTQSGTYNIDFIIGSKDDLSDTKFYLEFDQNKLSNPRMYTVPYSDVTSLGTVTVPNLTLSEGEHVMTFYPLGDLNFDKFIIKSSSSSVETDVLDESVLISVNNSTKSLDIQFSEPGFGAICLYNINGTIVYENQIEGNPNFSLDITDQPSGVYIVSLQTSSKSYKRKIIL